MEKIKDIVRKRSSKSLHRKSQSLDQRPGSARRSEDVPANATRTAAAPPPASDKDLPPVPAKQAANLHQSGPSTPLRPSSQWGPSSAQKQSPLSPQEQQEPYHHRQQQRSSPTAPVSAVPDRDSSLRFKRASPPHIEQDYDQYRNMLAQSATTGQQKSDQDVFHDAHEDAQPATSRSHQQKASREYGRRQINATDGNDLNMQGLSIADDDGTGVGRASTDPVPMNESKTNSRSSTDPLAVNQKATTRKALPSRPQENISPRDNQQDKSSDRPSYLPKLDQHPPPTTVSRPTDPNHTFSTSPNPDPLARLPPGFNPTNTVDTTVSTTVAPAVTHETRHTKHIEVVQEAITRDVHVDHYYHYVQPIRVVEVAPARHFRINSKGEKFSIAAPEGWQLPADLAPRRAPDFVNGEGADKLSGKEGTGKMGWTRRDYVVDEENPKGRMLRADELEEQRKEGRLVSPPGVVSGGGLDGSGSAVSSPVYERDNNNNNNNNQQGTAK